MANTTNFGWETPDDTDLVKDGALAMRTLGNAIDTSLVDLKGGTTGQVLSKNTNTDMDFVWTTPNVGDITEVQAGTGISVASGTGPIPVVTNTVATAFDAKGDLVAGTGADTFAKLTVGANNTVLTADSATATGLKWATPASGALVFINRSTFSNVAGVNIDNVFTSTYKTYLVVIENIYSNTDVTADALVQMRYGGTTLTAANYYGSLGWISASSADITLAGTNAGTSFKWGEALGDSTYRMTGQFFISRVGNTSERCQFSGTSNDYNYRAGWFGCNVDSAQTYDGLRFIASTGNITGIISIYGLATS